jgi:hypothetical protein
MPPVTVLDAAARRVSVTLPSTTEQVAFSFREIERPTDIVPEDHPDYDAVRAMMRWFRRRGAALDAQQMSDYSSASYVSPTESA